ncbi:MAG TPA: hypothetical protein VFV35_07770, partial [Acidimicrobiales bacterium]|nr:hypothetical protein [Acidimicrobiales bacterium]
RARDELLRDPPTTEEHILRPATYLDDDEVTEVETPELADGETLVEDSEDDFGMLSLLVVLAERIDFVAAWDSVQGWAGDASIAFERAGVTCVRAEVAFDAPTDADRFGEAFRQWAGDGEATVAVEGDRATFESCDPGTDTEPPADERISGVQGVFLRAGLVEGLRSSGAPLPVAECVADEVVAHFGADRLGQLDELLAEGPDDAATAELQRVAGEAVEGACADADRN